MRPRPLSAALAFLSAAYVLGWGYAATLTSFWGDEEFTAKAVEMPLREMFHLLRGDMHPPLYYLLLRPWHALTLSLPVELSLRWFSLACGLAALWAWLRVFERLLPGSRAPYGAFFLMAASPFFGWYATEAKMYQFYLLVTAAAWLCWLKLMDDPGSWRLRAAAGFFSACIPFTHITGMVGAMAFVIWLALEYARGGLRGPALKGALWALALGAVFFLPQMDTARYQVGRTRTFWAPEPSWNFFLDLARYGETYLTADLALPGWLRALWASAAMAGLAQALFMAPWPLRRMLAASGLGFFGAYWAASHYTVPFLIPRVTLPWAPLFFLGLCWSLEAWGGRRLMAAAMASFLILAAPVVARQHLGPGREDMRAAVDYLKAESRPGDTVLRASYLEDYYLGHAGLKFSGDGEIAARRAWVLRRQSDSAAPGAPWKRPEAHPELFQVLSRRSFSSSLDPFWTLEVFLIETRDRRGFRI